MSKDSKDYYNIVSESRSNMSGFEKIISKLIHQPVLGLVLHSLACSFFRIYPMKFGLVAAIVVGVFMSGVAYLYGYQITSLSVLGYVFVLGFIVGIIYEILKTLKSSSRR